MYLIAKGRVLYLQYSTGNVFGVLFCDIHSMLRCIKNIVQGTSKVNLFKINHITEALAYSS